MRAERDGRGQIDRCKHKLKRKTEYHQNYDPQGNLKLFSSFIISLSSLFSGWSRLKQTAHYVCDTLEEQTVKLNMPCIQCMLLRELVKIRI